MSGTVIDLRSDTVTRPSPRMRRAMAEAEVGDDVYREDPTVEKLQRRAAEVFGREAALFVPTGTMGNLASILAQTEMGQEVICDSRGHVYNYEMASMSAIAGVLPRVIETEDGLLDWPRIEAAIRPEADYRARTALVVLENTHNMAGGVVHPTADVHEICDQAHARGLRVHLDGARIFNAAAALGEDVAAMTRGADSVQFCLSKGLGAPLGSVIVGDGALVERCRRFRKMLGGGMRQAGVAAAAGLIALEEGPARLPEDHAHARLLADRLAAVPGLELAPETVQTNIVIFALAPGRFDAAGFIAALARRGVLAGAIDARRVRMVTHLDVGRNEVEQAAAAAAAVMEAGAS